MLSQTVEYALRAMVYLASLEGKPATTKEIARRTKVPASYLAKVLQGLVQGSLVQSRRGIGGGVSLSRSPQKITILDVVNAVEPLQRIKTCPLGIRSHGIELCPLHRRLDAALAAMEKAFGDSILAEVIAEPTKSPPLCEIRTIGQKKRKQ